MVFPVLTAAALGVLYDRLLGGHIFDSANGGAILWQHLFWFFGHRRLRHRAAVLRHRLRGHPGVLP